MEEDLIFADQLSPGDWHRATHRDDDSSWTLVVQMRVENGIVWILGRDVDGNPIGDQIGRNTPVLVRKEKP